MSIYKEFGIKAAAEMLSIVVAVLFALWANSWWSEREVLRQAAEMSVSIQQELNENLARLKVAHQHHSEQINSIKTYSKEHKTLVEADYQKMNRMLFSKGIFRPAELFFTNWDITRDKGLLSELSADELRLYKPSYNAMKRYQNVWKTIAEGQLMVTLFAKTEKEQLNLVMSSLSQLWWSEKNAIRVIENKAITQ